MKTAKIADMKRGWFIGNFEPSLFKTNDVEVAVKQYRTGNGIHRAAFRPGQDVRPGVCSGGYRGRRAGRCNGFLRAYGCGQCGGQDTGRQQ